MILNGIPVETAPLGLLATEHLAPAFRKREFGAGGKQAVFVRIYAGLSDSDPQKAGWYVLCNGRLVLGADQTNRTGWGEEGEKIIPKYHNQFARFRGYVFFDSDDAALLPWNTTKTGVDSDSSLFQAVRLDMISTARPVIDFLNALKDEVDVEEGTVSVSELVDTAEQVPLEDIPTSEAFVAPAVATVRRASGLAHISYRRPLAQVERAQAMLGAHTRREVGEKTFDYYYKLECDE